jgi:hypothetical protein
MNHRLPDISPFERPLRTRTAALVGCIALLAAALSLGRASAIVPPATETIVMVRHGEKPQPSPKGQLNCQGLNRALALPAVLARFGHPAAVYAPNPSVQTSEGNPFPGAARYSYVRPLATIEPYAIAQDMPVNTQIAADDIHGLQQEVLKPEYASSLVVIAWEHIRAHEFAELMLKTFGQGNVVPHWENSDYETIYIFRISTGPDSKRTLTFTVERENLNGLPKTCPGIAPPASPTPETPPATQPALPVPPPA